MSARERDWIMVRLKRTTHEMLCKVAEKWQQMGRDGNDLVPYEPDGDRPSLDRVIAELLSRDMQHRARSVRSKVRKRTQRPLEDRPEPDR